MPLAYKDPPFIEEGHYKKGIQPKLMNAILKKTQNLSTVNEEVIINIDDLNENFDLVKPKKQKLMWYGK